MRKRLLSLLLSFIMTFQLLTGSTIVFGAEQDARTYSYENFEVEFKLSEQFSGTSIMQLQLSNTGSSAIENWSLGFELEHNISYLTEADIYLHEDDLYILKGRTYNKDILPGQNITMQVNLDTDGEVLNPSSFNLCTQKQPLPPDDYRAELKITSDYGSGGGGEFVITNLSGAAIDNWEVQFTFDKAIASFWTASFQKDGDRYTVNNSGYNGTIQPGAALSLGFSLSEGNVQNPAQDIAVYADVIVKPEKDPVSDSDADGLPDDYELLVLQTDPNEKDSDRNGVSDGSEDPDGDSLTNLEEFSYGTSPIAADSDWDGLSDGEEIFGHNTSPVHFDTDGDGIGDGDELAVGLDPLEQYTHDGVHDSEYTFEQEVSKDFSDAFDMAVKLEASGNADSSLKILESALDSQSTANRAVVGEPVSLSYDEELTLGQVEIEFELADSYTGNTGSRYEQVDEGLAGIKRYQIFRFDPDEEILYPVETEFDETNGTLSTTTEELGDYCVIDMEKWLYSLGVEFEQPDAVPLFTPFSGTSLAEILPEAETTSASAIDIELQGGNAAEDEAIDTREHEPLPEDYEQQKLQEIYDMYGESMIQPFAAARAQSRSAVSPNAQADVVFLVDTSGSMGGRISTVKNNLARVIQKLYDDNITVNTAVVSYGDYISNKADAVRTHSVNGDYWGSTPEKAAQLINQVNLWSNGYETNLDAAAYVLKNTKFVSKRKYVFLVTDEPHIYNNNRYGYVNLQAVANDYAKEDIVLSVVCYNGDAKTLAPLYQTTGGIQTDITSSFVDILAEFIRVSAKQTSNYHIVSPVDLSVISLEQTPIMGHTLDTDGDTLSDSAEIDWSKVELINSSNTLILPTLEEYIKEKNKNYPDDLFARLESEHADKIASITVLPILSNPAEVDSDFDGLEDPEDQYPLRHAQYDLMIDGSILDMLRESYDFVSLHIKDKDRAFSLILGMASSIMENYINSGADTAAVVTAVGNYIYNFTDVSTRDEISRKISTLLRDGHSEISELCDVFKEYAAYEDSYWFGRVVGNAASVAIAVGGTAKGVSEAIAGIGITTASIGITGTSGGTTSAISIPAAAEGMAIAAAGTATASVSIAGGYSAIRNMPDDFDKFMETRGSSGGSGSAITDKLSEISKSHKNLECVETADEMKAFLQKNGLHGEEIIINYDGDRGFIVSETYVKEAISTNGMHKGILYNGRVYDNIHSQGLPLQDWLDDFYGLGQRTITRNSF